MDENFNVLGYQQYKFSSSIKSQISNFKFNIHSLKKYAKVTLLNIRHQV